MHKAYSVLTVKTVQDEARTIRGVATTPEADRVGDVVEPLGVKFKNPLPLLWQHDSAAPVGTTKFDKPTKDGITFEAQFPKDLEPGTLKDRVDEAWQSVKLGLVRGVSIGFRPIKHEWIEDEKEFITGVRFLQSEVLELSLVTIPANIDASIQQIKAFDDLNTRPGITPEKTESPTRPGITSAQPIKLAPKDATTVKTYAEQIDALVNKRAANEAALAAIQDKCSEESRTKDDAEREKFDTLSDEIDGLDKELGDLRRLESINRTKAQPIVAHSPETASQSRAPAMAIHMRANVPEGTAFTRMVIAHANALLTRRNPYDVAKSMPHWYNTPEVAEALSVDQHLLVNAKAASGVGTTTDATFAAPLIAYTQAADQFAALLRPLTIIGRIPGLRRVPFNIQIPRETASAVVQWVGEDAPKPVSKGAFDSIQLRWAKAAGIVGLSQELVRFSNPAAEGVIREQLTNQMAQYLDRQFIDPSVAAVLNVSPASVTNGVTPITASGTTSAAFRVDARTLLDSMLVNNQQIGSGVWIGTQQQAVGFVTTYTSLGVRAYPDMAPTGGNLLGFPFIASENLPATGGSPADGYPLIFMIPSEILLADDGTTLIDVSTEASVQMDTAPNSPPSASTVLYSAFQNNAIFIRAERWINWMKRRSNVVGFIQNAKYAE